jgi:RNA polymerase sigma factor (sigma-70 family)
MSALASNRNTAGPAGSVSPQPELFRTPITSGHSPPRAVTGMLPSPNPGDTVSRPLSAREMGEADAHTSLDAGAGLGELTGALADGDEPAFMVFYERYYDRLFRYLIVLTKGDEPLTRDLLQVTLVKGVRAIKPFAEECQFWKWLKSIARNTFLDALRQASREPNLVPLFEVDAEAHSAPNNSEDQRPLFEALDACLAELSPSERDLVETCYVRNFSQQAAAAQRNTTAKAVESRLARVRLKLRFAILKRLRHENF